MADSVGYPLAGLFVAFLGASLPLAFWVDGGRVLAGMNVNVWDVNAHVQELIRSRREVDLAALTDADTPLDALAAGGVSR